MRSEGQAEHPRRLAAAIFDVDGVLVASPHERAWQEALAGLMEGEWRDIAPATSYRPNLFDSAVYQAHVSGKPRMSGARAVLDFFGVPDSAMRAVEYAERKQRRIRELIAAGEFVAFVDALRFLVALRGRNVRTAAASSSKNANDFMRQIDVAEFLTAGQAASGYLSARCARTPGPSRPVRRNRGRSGGSRSREGGRDDGYRRGALRRRRSARSRRRRSGRYGVGPGGGGRTARWTTTAHALKLSRSRS